TARTQTRPRQTKRGAEMFRALAHRNFRLFWTGAFLSNAGTWMQSVAQAWLVLQLTNSGTWLGVDNFMATSPGLILTLVGGVIADLVDRKRLLIYTQAVAGLAALVLTVLIVTGAVRIWSVLALTFVTGCCWAVSSPSYMALTVDLVEREDLANAIALNSTQFQLARVIGPVAAALTIRAFGLSGCFLANGLSYAAIVAALSQVRFERPGRTQGAATGETEAAGTAANRAAVNDTTANYTTADGSAAGEAETVEAEAVATAADAASAKAEVEARRVGGPASLGAGRALTDRRAMWSDLVEGFRYVRGRPRVGTLLLCSAVVSLFGTPYIVLAPLFARNVYGWGETGLSLMMGTAGAGALIGALTLAYLGDFRRKGWFVLASSFSGGTCIVGFALVPQATLALPLFFAVGFSMVSFFAVGNTLMQQLVTDEMRGRVMSMWILTFIGTMPFGSFLSGAAADRYGPRPTLAACGLVIVLFVLTMALRNPRLREI
ncbi:MAG: MFS transporter, partial [Acidobacteriota bacterium]|nr:MFS transporter [Acidobacteriota bacterium]